MLITVVLKVGGRCVCFSPLYILSVVPIVLQCDHITFIIRKQLFEMFTVTPKQAKCNWRIQTTLRVTPKA